MNINEATIEEDDTCSHYQINLQQFKQTIREKANFGFRSLGRMSHFTRRSIQFIDELPPSHEEEASQDYRQTFLPSAGSLSDTPPNTPSSSESTASSVIINDPRKLLTDAIRKQSQKPSGGHNNNDGRGAEEHVVVDVVDGSVEEAINGTDNYWIGQKIAEKRLNSKTPSLRNYWEQNSERDKQEQIRQSQMQSKRRPFGFPKWRSNDAMSASLVASGKVQSMIPKDSNIPEFRKQKFEESERKAEYEKQQLHQKVIPKRPLHKGKSLESLTMQMDYKPWYDRERIRNSVSRESIANLGAAKEKFEREDYIDRTEPIHRQFGTEFNNRPTTPHSQQPSRPATSMGKPMATGNSPPPAPMHQPHPNQLHQQQQNYNIQQPYHQQQHHHQQQQQQHMQYPYHHSQHPQQQQLAAARQQQAVNLSADHYQLLQYIKQNPTVFNDFGIEIPKKLYNLVDDLAFPAAESNAGMHIANGRHPTPVQPVPPTPQNRGRYLKNGMQNNGNPRFRRTYDMSQKQMPENRRQSMQELDHSKAGNNLIAAEIRAIQEREDELRRSRSELGLPNLEDTLELWKLGYHSRHPSKNLLREASSYDHLNHFHASTDDLNPYEEDPSASAFIHHQHQQPHFHQQQQQYVPSKANYNGTANSAHHQQYNPEQYNQFEYKQHQPIQSTPVQQHQQHFGQQHPHQAESPSTNIINPYIKERQSGGTPIIIGSTNPTKDRSSSRGPSQSTSTTTATTGNYQLHKSEDPDVMIYGPAMSRRNNPTDSIIKVIESPAFGRPPNGLRNIRYE